MLRLKGVKKAVGEAKRSHFYRVYLDKATGEVYTYTYADCNSWTVFHDRNMVEVCYGSGMYSIFGFNGLTQEQLKECVREVI